MASSLSNLVVCFCLVISFPVAANENPLIQQLERIKRQTGIGAVSYALVEGNKVIATGGMGEYGVDNKRPVTENSLFRVGSITKTFTALAVMHLVEQDKLELNQAVKMLDSDLPLYNPWPITPVTLAMLLEHTAGLQDLTRTEFDHPEPLELQAALAVKPNARQLHWPPGYHYSYSNLGAGYVGRVIETVTDEDYDDWFKKEILNTLDMDDSELQWTKKLEQNLVTGYDKDLKTKIPYWHTLFRPFGGLNTTARDMAKFLLVFTDKSDLDHNIISVPSLERMETPGTSLAAKVGLETGYGLGIRKAYFNGHQIYGHGGDGDGYLAEFAYSKESQRAYFLVINAYRHDILDEFTGPLNNWLIEGLSEHEEATTWPTVKSLPMKKLQALTGEYREVTKRFPFQHSSSTETIWIKNINNKLFRCFSNKNTNKCTGISPVSENLFRVENEQHASMAFIKAPDGNLYFQTGFGNYQKMMDTP